MKRAIRSKMLLHCFLIISLLCIYPRLTVHAQSGSIKGKVINENGTPLQGVSINVKGANLGTITNDAGEFTIEVTGKEVMLMISSIGYKKQEVRPAGMGFLTITLKQKSSELDQAVIIAYGTTTRRLNTGDVSKVTAEEIERQPVSNPLAALEGRVPGLIVTQSSGMPGAAFKVQLHGQSSLLQGSDPLFIIDGVPFAPGNSPINQITTSAILSPFNLINPDNIESIEVLKDADATAIYGSRGANGVIIITTKKAKPGKTRFTANLYTGVSRVTRTMPMLNTKQYIEMRREALNNDGLAINATNAPDLVTWDTTRYTDLTKFLIGGTARTSNVQTSISGGDSNTQFLIASGYHHETTVSPGNLADNRASIHSNINHTSSDKKFNIELIANYTSDKNNLNAQDGATSINAAPDLKFLNSNGSLNWQENGTSYGYYIHPLSFMFTKYTAEFQNLLSNLKLGYELIPDLVIKADFGYNLVLNHESAIYPSSSINPYYGGPPYSFFSTQIMKDWNFEPRIEYNKTIGKGKINALIGSTFHEILSQGDYIYASNYSSDILLNSVNGAGYSNISDWYNQYKYNAIFGRINYNWNEKYILNLTGRRDGSSRFGPGKQFANFGAIGAAWIFSNVNALKIKMPFLSFGKLRGSYGITGNDQIQNYGYLDAWTASSITYQGISTLNPTSLFNPDYSWEKNRKAEIALELGFLNGRISSSSVFFKNLCDNQLIPYKLPIQTGFSSVTENINALIQNTGFEFTLTSENIINKSFTWSSSLNLTINRNKLIKFPGLEQSTYAKTYVIGKPVSIQKLYQLLGVDPNTGFYKIRDVDSNGVLDSRDQIVLKDITPKFYGGFDNSFTYKSFQLDIFLQFVKQTGSNYYKALGTYVPGLMKYNQPLLVLNRWQKPGDITNIQKYTTQINPAATLIAGTDLAYSDASFIRCKNISLSYNLSTAILKRIPIESCKVYLEAQNLFTVTNYIGADPETQNIFLPPMKTMAIGIQLNF